MVRFDALSDVHGKIALSELIDTLIHVSAAGRSHLWCSLSAGMVGACLRKSPAGQPLAHDLPAVRDWLSFTTERTSEKSLCLLVGVAGRRMPDEAAAFLRPLGWNLPVQSRR